MGIRNVLSILIITALFFGCTKKNLFVNEKKVDSILKIAFVGKPELNWVSSQDAHSQLTRLLQDPLLEAGIVNGKLQILPALVDHWAFLSPTSLHLELSKSRKWGNGKTLTSTQVIESWKELLLASSTNAHASLLYCVSNARLFAEHRVPFSMVGVRTDSLYSIDLRFQTPCPHFPLLLSHLALSPRDNYPWSVENGHFLPRPWETLGPWNFVSQWPIHEVLVRSNSWKLDSEKKSKWDRLLFSFFSNLNEPLQLWEDKRVDMVLEEKYTSSLPSHPVTSFKSLNSAVLVFDPYKRPFQNAKIREALIRAIDKSEIIRFSGNAFEETDRLLPFLDGEIKKHEFSASIAKKLLGETKLTNLVLAIEKDPLLTEVAKNLQAQWKKNLNLDVELEFTNNPESSVLSLEKFRPNFTEKAMGLEEWAHFSSADFLSPVLSGVGGEKIEPFKVYLDRLSKMEQWMVEEEKLVIPLVALKRNVYMQSGISGLEYQPIRDIFDFSSAEKN